MFATFSQMGQMNNLLQMKRMRARKWVNIWNMWMNYLYYSRNFSVSLNLKYKIKRKTYFIIASNLPYTHIHASVILYVISLE